MGHHNHMWGKQFLAKRRKMSEVRFGVMSSLSGPLLDASSSRGGRPEGKGEGELLAPPTACLY